MGVPEDNYNNEGSKISTMNESEKKRLESVKRKKETFKAKELAVKNALKNLDSNCTKNKIIFDEDIDKIEQPKIKRKAEKRKPTLFDDDEEDADWNEHDFNLKTDKSGKPIGKTITLGNDKRFKLDERFMEDDTEFNKDSPNKDTEDESDLQKEKEMQLDILENILGVPIVQKKKDFKKESKVRKKEMIRYDPTENDHKEYEIVQDKTEENTKKVKKKKKPSAEKTENNENPPVEVSQDVYFSVSESLSKSLKESGQFSLLKTCGREESTEKELPGDTSYHAPSIKSSKNEKCQFNFDTKNPFKYDSSDNENDNKEISPKDDHIDIPKETNNNFFFDENDVRFNEAIKFFSKDFAQDGEFRNLRRELKQIVRSKIRRNVKKHQPWGKNKRIKRF